jgi:hypothetical protein
MVGTVVCSAVVHEWHSLQRAGGPHFEYCHTFRSTAPRVRYAYTTGEWKRGRTAGLGRDAVDRVVGLALRAHGPAQRDVRARLERAPVLVDVRDRELDGRVVLGRDQAVCPCGQSPGACLDGWAGCALVAEHLRGT